MYDNKYLKYKNKYLSLKMRSITQIGGAHPWGGGGGGGGDGGGGAHPWGGGGGGGGGGGACYPGGAGYPACALPFLAVRRPVLPPPPVLHRSPYPVAAAPPPPPVLHRAHYPVVHALVPNPEHVARPFLLNERVIVDRRRIAKIISICQNSPDIGGNISYNIHYVDTDPRELEMNISENRLIRLPKNIISDKYQILQPGESVMVNNGSEERGVINQIRDNVRECYSVRYTGRAMAFDAKTGKTLGSNSDECVDISKIRRL